MEKDLTQESNNLLKIVLFGPESTGKTTLYIQLAKHYNTVWVEEFARPYLQEVWNNEQRTCELSDILPIARGQINLENKLAKQANKVLICDTDLLETKVYSSEYFEGYVDPMLEKAAVKNTYDLYLLTYIDTTWIADDLRDRPNQRLRMYHAFKKVLDEYKRPYVSLKGDKHTRFKIAVMEIDQLLKKQRLK